MTKDQYILCWVSVWAGKEDISRDFLQVLQVTRLSGALHLLTSVSYVLLYIAAESLVLILPGIQFVTFVLAKLVLSLTCSNSSIRILKATYNCLGHRAVIYASLACKIARNSHTTSPYPNLAASNQRTQRSHSLTITLIITRQLHGEKGPPSVVPQ